MSKENDKPLVSIITVCYNSKKHIRDTIESVLNQTYDNIEYIIVDGESKDNTLDIIEEYESKFKGRMRWISESDEGIYDAMNKGIEMSTGDIIGFLNSDDFYVSEDIIENISLFFKKNKNIDACYGDLERINTKNNKVVRKEKIPSQKKRLSKFIFGWHPTHQSVYIKKRIYDKYGDFNLDYDIAADFDLLCRFIEKNEINIKYLPKVILKMRNGGESNKDLKSIIKGNIECYKSLKKNNLFPYFIFIKPLRKLFRKAKTLLGF